MGTGSSFNYGPYQPNNDGEWDWWTDGGDSGDGSDGPWDQNGNFTGDTSYSGSDGSGGTDWLNGIGGISGLASLLANILSGTSNGLNQGRIQAALLNQGQANAAANIFNTRMRAALIGPRLSAEDAVRGDTQANVQPFQFTGENKMVGNIPVPQTSGGLGPQNFGPATRQAGRDLAAQGASRVNSPSFNLPEPPVLPPINQSGTGTDILNWAALIASLLGAGGHGGGGQSLQNQGIGWLSKILAGGHNSGGSGDNGYGTGIGGGGTPSNTDPFWGWGPMPGGGKPLPNMLWPNAPEDPNHD